MNIHNKRDFPERAELKVVIVETEVEEIVRNHEYRHLDGYVPFDFRYIKNYSKLTEDETGKSKVVREVIIESQNDLTFNEGDEIRIDNKLFKILAKDEFIPDKYRKPLGMYPRLRNQYVIKRMILQ